ncbi:MAG: DUF4365 domain-containing protein [Symploca sp. SIO1B1]|nr:DUF4365 domain-containing protein [Symploca sp. SIO1A3]NES00455.1 DUF4365 domain-containing protein [Symploca sp. SIO1B1]
MATKEAWYIGQRAESLAMMYLTRRHDLVVSRQQEEQDLDFLVTLLKDGAQTGRLFGVQVKAIVSTPKSTQFDDSIEIKLALEQNTLLPELPFPVCLFFFTLGNDQGYYKWILEPVIQSQPNFQLLLNQKNDLKELNDEEIGNMISVVNSWYDLRK